MQDDLDNPPPLALLPEQSFTVEETMRLLKFSRATVYREVARGRLKATGSRRLMRFTLREIRRYQEASRP